MAVFNNLAMGLAIRNPSLMHSNIVLPIRRRHCPFIYGLRSQIGSILPPDLPVLVAIFFDGMRKSLKSVLGLGLPSGDRRLIRAIHHLTVRSLMFVLVHDFPYFQVSCGQMLYGFTLL